MTPPSNPYVGPRSLQIGERLYGRDREMRDLLGLLIAERIVLLYSPSGAGKTSLIQAGLIPELERQEFTILPVMRVNLAPLISAEALPAMAAADTNSWSQRPSVISRQPAAIAANSGGPNRFVQSLLASLEEGLPAEQRHAPAELADMSLAQYLDQWYATDTTQDVVLLFDQFEEILVIDPANQAAKAEFFAQVGEALRNRQRWALFAMREEYVAGLDNYLRAIPTHLDTRFRLDLLGVNAARQSIRRPAEEAGVTFETDAADKLIDDLRQVQTQQPDGTVVSQPGPYVEPVQLQVVCSRLWEHKFATQSDTTPEPRITLADLATIGDVNDSLSAYYAESVAAAATSTDSSERSIRDWFDTALISPQRLRGQVLQGPEQSEGLDNRTITPLVDSYLVRAEKRRGATWLELAHDRLIEPVLSDNAAWREAHLSPLQRQATLWEARDRPDNLLFKDADLASAERWATEHAADLNETEQAFLARCREVRAIIKRARRTNRIIRGLAVAAALTAILALGLAYWANEQYRRSLSRQLAATSGDLANGPLARTLLLAREANNIRDTPESRAALLRGLTTSPHLSSFLRGENPRMSRRVNGVAVSPDGKIIAAVTCAERDEQGNCNRGEVRWWDAATGQQLGDPQQAHDGIATNVAFSPDGKLLATGGADGTIVLWDVATRQPRGTPLVGNHSAVRGLAFDPSGRLLAAAGCVTDDRTARCPEGQVNFWDVTTAAPDGEPIKGHKNSVDSLAFSPDGALLATTGEGQQLILWDMASRTQADTQFVSNGDNIYSLAFSPDGQLLALGRAGGSIELLDVASRTLRSQLPGHQSLIFGLAFSPDGDLLASASLDTTMRIWDVAKATQVGAPLTGHLREVTGVAFGSDSNTLVSSSADATVVRWNLAQRQRLGTELHVDGMTIESIAYNPSGALLASAGCEYDSDDLVNETCARGITHVWDLASGKPIGEAFNSPAGARMQVAFSPDGTLLAVTGCATFDEASKRCTRGAVHLLDSNGRPLGEPLQGHDDAVFSLAFSPDGATLASGGRDGTTILWNVRDRAQIETLNGGAVWGLAFSNDGKQLAISSPETGLEVYDLASKEYTLHRGDLQTTSVAAAPHESRFVSGDQTGNIYFDAQADATNAHSGPISDLAYNLDGSLLASASADQSVILWDAPNQRRIWPLTGHTAVVTSVAFSPDNKTLASGSFDGTIILWDVSLDSWRNRACALAGRNLTEDEWQQYLPDEPYRETCAGL